METGRNVPTDKIDYGTRRAAAKSTTLACSSMRYIRDQHPSIQRVPCMEWHCIRVLSILQLIKTQLKQTALQPQWGILFISRPTRTTLATASYSTSTYCCDINRREDVGVVECGLVCKKKHDQSCTASFGVFLAHEWLCKNNYLIERATVVSHSEKQKRL